VATENLPALIAQREAFATWIRRGGFIVLLGHLDPQMAKKLEELIAGNSPLHWTPIPPDHELMRSFYLLDSLPSCNGEGWRGFQLDNRLAVISAPFDILAALEDRHSPGTCTEKIDNERAIRVFVNLVMVAMATDYKKDQIHLPEILKRLR
ncbi:MAG: DUF4159 domain-containing protein, partial [Pseudomonadota bacterium]